MDIQAQAFTSGAGAVADSSQRMRNSKGVFFVRIFRDGTDYHMFYSQDGSTWQSLMGTGTGAVGTVLTHLWIAVRNPATTTAEPVPITAFKWIRQGGSGIDPWDPTEKAPTVVVSGEFAGTTFDALYNRPSDETVHPDDQEFETDVDTSTLLVVSGTGVATQKRHVHSIVYDGVTANDMVAALWPLSESFPVTVETSGRSLINNANFHQVVPVMFSDGVTATDDVVIIGMHRAGTIGFNFGTFTSLDNSGGSSTSIGGLAPPTGRHYFRLIWSAANTFKVLISVDGVTWSNMDIGNLARTITPTHFGFGGTTWGASDPGMVSADYFRITAADLSL